MGISMGMVMMLKHLTKMNVYEGDDDSGDLVMRMGGHDVSITERTASRVVPSPV